MVSVTLDRMEIEEAGTNKPERLARAIHDQLAAQMPRVSQVPVEAIAAALDITAIRREPLTQLEGALVTTDDRAYGAILVNAKASPSRQRFTIAHELGHYLNLWHSPSVENGFSCTRAQMRSWSTRASRPLTRDEIQEREANRFAIELLLPAHLTDTLVDTDWDLGQLSAFARTFGVSKEAAARRLIEQSEEPVAILFLHNGELRYHVRSVSMPSLILCKGDPAPSILMAGKDGAGPTTFEIPAGDLCTGRRRGLILGECQVQRDGHAIVLIRSEDLPVDDRDRDDDDEDEDGAPEDTVSRFDRWQGR